MKPGQSLQVEKLDAEVGKDVDLKVLWANDTDGTSSDAKAGSNSAAATAQVVRHLRGKKVLVFKKRPKKHYEKMQGHRQDLTEIKIKDIKLGGK